jgi:hypothetical protein
LYISCVLEVEQLDRTGAVVDEPVERRQQRGSALEVAVEQGRVDAPLTLRPFDDRRRSFLTRVASSTDGTSTDGYTFPGRSQRRSRPTRPAIATSARIIRYSSI